MLAVRQTRRKVRHLLVVLLAAVLIRRKLRLLLVVLPAVQLTRTRSNVTLHNSPKADASFDTVRLLRE